MSSVRVELALGACRMSLEAPPPWAQTLRVAAATLCMHCMPCSVAISRSAVFALHAWAAGEVCEGCQCTHANHTELLAIGDLGAGAVSLAMGPALHVVNTVPRHKDWALSKRQK